MQAYEAIEPMGSYQSNYMAAMICAVVINVVQSIFRDKKSSKPKTFTPADFMPEWGLSERSDKSDKSPAKAQTIEEMKAAFQHIAKLSNRGKIKRRPPRERL